VGPPKMVSKREKHSFFHFVFTIVSKTIVKLTASIIWLIFTIFGAFVLSKRISPWDILLGLPMLLTGGGFIVNNFTSVVLCLIPKYNEQVCIYCRKDRVFKDHKKIKEILGLK